MALERRLTDEELQTYRRQGFAVVREAISPGEVDECLAAVERVLQEVPSYREDAILNQRVNLWQQCQVIRRLTFHMKIASLAEQLAGRPLRFWHDQLLIKNANSQTPTEFHQDQPYWPLENAHESITAWIALTDVPVESGCMCFMPGSHCETDLPRQELDDEDSLFVITVERPTMLTPTRRIKRELLMQ